MSWSWTLREFYFRRTRCCSPISDIPLKRCKDRELMSDIRGTFIQTISKELGANDAMAWKVEWRLRLKCASAAYYCGIVGFLYYTIHLLIIVTEITTISLRRYTSRLSR